MLLLLLPRLGLSRIENHVMLLPPLASLRDLDDGYDCGYSEKDLSNRRSHLLPVRKVTCYMLLLPLSS